MILVVALNPALDITHHVAGADWAGVNRPHAVHARPGGKGLNVARTLRALRQDVTLAGLAGGRTGEEIADGLAGTGIEVALSPVMGETRRTFTVADSVSGQAALFNEPGPAIGAGEYERFLVDYEKTVRAAQAVVLSGSLPPQVPDDAYAGLIAAARAAGVPAILDTSGAALRHGAAAGPAMVKPNLAELGELAGRGQAEGAGRGSPGGALARRRAGAARGGAGAAGAASDGAVAGGAGFGASNPVLEAVRQVARELVCAGAGAVVVSLGPAGLVAVTGEGDWRARPPGPVRGNPTGAGDAVVAGLADGLVRGLDWPGRLRQAVALGTATAGSLVAGEFDVSEFRRLLDTVSVTAMGQRDRDDGDCAELWR